MATKLEKKKTKLKAKKTGKKTEKKTSGKKVGKTTKKKSVADKEVKPPFDLNKASIDSITVLHRIAKNLSNKTISALEVLTVKRVSPKEAMKAKMILHSSLDTIKTLTEIEASKDIATVLKALGLGDVYYKEEIKESDNKTDNK